MSLINFADLGGDTLDLADTVSDSFNGLISGGIEFLPRLLIAIIIVLTGSILAGWVSKLATKLLGVVEDNSMVKSILKTANIKQINVASVVGKVLGWIVLIVFYSAAADALELAVLSSTIDSLVSYIPRIIAAVVVGAVTFVASNAVAELVLTSAKKAKIGVANGLSTASKIAVLIFGIPLAIAQLGLDMTIINNNISIIVAGVVAAFALAFGLGGREVAAKILDDLYKKSK